MRPRTRLGAPDWVYCVWASMQHGHRPESRCTKEQSGTSMDGSKTGEIIVTKADEDAIREIELRFNQAWGQHDPDAMVESLVDDAQFVTVNGAWTKSRDGFRDLMRRLHGANGPFRSSTRETPEMHVRFLAPDVAVMHSRFHIYGDVDESERTSIGTRVVRKVDGRWRTVAVQNTDLRSGRRH